MARVPVAVYFYISQSLRLCAKGTIYIFLCFFITAVSTLHLFAQTPADKIDFNVIDQYITAKMQAPPRIPGVALAIVKGDQMFDLAILALTVILIISLMRISKQYKPDLGYWLETIAVIIFLKGLLEIALIWHVFRQTGHSVHRA